MPAYRCATRRGRLAQDLRWLGVLGFGVFGRYRLDDRWTVALGVDMSDEFDIERTPELVGLVQDPKAPVVDSTGSSEGLSALGRASLRGR